MSRILRAVATGATRLGGLLRPREFFGTTVRANDQAPAVYHIIIIGIATAAIRLGVGPVPTVGGSPLTGAVVWIAITGLFIAPIALHLAAAVATVMLMMTAPKRAGISMTVQVWAYAATPVVLTAVDQPALTLIGLAAAASLTVIGTAEVHRLSIRRAVLAAALPIAIVYGVGLGGFTAVMRLVG